MDPFESWPTHPPVAARPR